VRSAKVICNDAYEAGRKDLIVVYADDAVSMRQTAAKIQSYRPHPFPDTLFREPLPVGIKWLARGLGTASQPPAVAVLLDTGGPSYGKYLSQVLAIAYQAALRIKKGALYRNDFFRVAAIVLRKAGIDPLFPDTIGAPAVDFASACPFLDETFIPLTMLGSIEAALADSRKQTAWGHII